MAKHNSMDVIQIRYGVDLSSPPGADASIEEKQAFENKKAQAKTCSLRAFIYPEQYPDQAPKFLNESEKGIQEALRFIYEQNEKEGLFKKFPNWRQALVIDCTTAPSKYVFGKFNTDLNTIIFRKSLHPSEIIKTLAHELKHAEHCTKKIYKIQEEKVGADNLGIQQTFFVDEGIAHSFGNYVQMLYYMKDGNLSKKELIAKMRETEDAATEDLLEPLLNWFSTEPKPTFLDRLLKRNPQKSYKDLEQQLIPLALNALYGTPYKSSYEILYPIQKTDKGLQSIPKDFRLEKSYAKSLLLGKLQEIPKGTVSEILQYVSEQVKKRDAEKALRNTGKQNTPSVKPIDKNAEGVKKEKNVPQNDTKVSPLSVKQQMVLKNRRSQH